MGSFVETRIEGWFDLKTPDKLREAILNLSSINFGSLGVDPYLVIGRIQNADGITSEKKNDLIKIVREKAGLTVKRKDI